MGVEATNALGPDPPGALWVLALPRFALLEGFARCHAARSRSPSPLVGEGREGGSRRYGALRLTLPSARARRERAPPQGGSGTNGGLWLDRVHRTMLEAAHVETA